jgi:FkbM family methyltransferase
VNLANELQRIRPQKVVHVGAHRAQEAEIYDAVGASVVWVEGDMRLEEALHDRLAAFPRQHVAMMLCSDERSRRHFYRASNDGESSSLFPFDQHARYMPDVTMEAATVATTCPLDDLGLEPDWLTLDVQGAELLVLRGAHRTLDTVESIWCEVSRVPLYRGGAQFDEITQALTARSFDLVDVDWSMFDGQHGDALYERVKLVRF